MGERIVTIKVRTDDSGKRCDPDCEHFRGSDLWGATWCVAFRCRGGTCPTLRRTKGGDSVRLPACRRAEVHTPTRDEVGNG